MSQVCDSMPKHVAIGVQARQQPESPRPNCTVNTISSGKAGRSKIAASFDGGDISSGAGGLLLRRADERIGLNRPAFIASSAHRASRHTGKHYRPLTRQALLPASSSSAHIMMDESIGQKRAAKHTLLFGGSTGMSN